MIFYFSGTGNTRWAATQLAETTGDKTIDIATLKESGITYKLNDKERMGFCFPVHGWRPPIIVREFIKRLHIENAHGHYIFALCTAGDNIGETMKIFEADLKAKDLTVDSEFSLIMPESYVGLPFMDVDTSENELRKKHVAAEELNHYAQLITNRVKGSRHLHIGRWPKINSRILGGFFTSHLITDRPFHVMEERCIRCGLCAAVCPVKNIIGGKGFSPQWKHNESCTACMTCYHHCPKHAIEYGCRTKGKGQYYFEARRNESE